MSRMRRDRAQAEVGHLGWRLLLGRLHAVVPVTSFAQAAAVVGGLATLGTGVTDHLEVVVVPGAVRLRLATPQTRWVSEEDLSAARAVGAAVEALGLTTGPGGAAAPPAVQAVEIAVDALDIPAVLPFWAAVLGYVVSPADPEALDDPRGEGPSVWFQQMDAPRPQRNRLHLDVVVPHDQAPARLGAALAAGGTLLDDSAAPAFWVLADAEGNEACVCTWQGRDDRDPSVA